MAEALTLDTAITTTEVITSYRVRGVQLDVDLVLVPETRPGYVAITLKDNLGATSFYTYSGDRAIEIIRAVNTADLSSRSLNTRILELLEADGLIPPGSIVVVAD